jgi:catechol 2,3-dioxygenase-like lactoylglutathione lyase family enzyme
MPVLNRFDHVHVFVADLVAAEIWYDEVLGLRRDPALEHWATPGGPLTLRDPSGGIELAVFEQPSQPCRSVLAFNVSGDEFLRWQTHLAEKLGQKPPAVDHESAWSLYFSDPFGNPYEITSHDYEALRNTLTL